MGAFEHGVAGGRGEALGVDEAVEGGDQLLGLLQRHHHVAAAEHTLEPRAALAAPAQEAEVAFVAAPPAGEVDPTGGVQRGEVHMGAVERLQAATDCDALGAAEERDPQAVAVALADAREHEVAAVLELFLVGDGLHALGELARQRGEVERLVDEVRAQPARQRVALLVLLEAAEALGAAAFVLRAQALGQAQRGGVEHAGRVAQHQARRRAGLLGQVVDDQVGDGVLDRAHGWISYGKTGANSRTRWPSQAATRCAGSAVGDG